MLACPGFPVLAQGLTCQSEYDVAANLPNALVFASLVLMLNSSPANTLICFSFGDIRASVKELVVMKAIRSTALTTWQSFYFQPYLQIT